jgi:hypothetical protein
MHAGARHSAESLKQMKLDGFNEELHASLSAFSCSPLEKQNYNHSLDFFRLTARGGFGRSYLDDIMRIELLKNELRELIHANDDDGHSDDDDDDDADDIAPIADHDFDL